MSIWIRSFPITRGMTAIIFWMNTTRSMVQRARVCLTGLEPALRSESEHNGRVTSVGLISAPQLYLLCPDLRRFSRNICGKHEIFKKLLQSLQIWCIIKVQFNRRDARVRDRMLYEQEWYTVHGYRHGSLCYRLRGRYNLRPIT